MMVNVVVVVATATGLVERHDVGAMEDYLGGGEGQALLESRVRV